MSNFEPDAKNSVLGELIVALVRAPEPIQEAILVYALKQMQPLGRTLIEPYPMLSHMNQLLSQRTGTKG